MWAVDNAEKNKPAQRGNNSCTFTRADFTLHTMSQNAHTLQLFFDSPIKLKTAQLAYQYLVAGNTEQAQRWAGELGVADLDDLWDGEWFNQQVAAKPTHLLLCFDTGTHDDLPLRALETLFAHGLRAAVLEVFYDQVGETERMHFDQGQWVGRQTFFSAHPDWRAVVEPADGGDDAQDDPYACSRDPAKPMSVAKMRKDEADRRKQGEEAAKAFIDLAQTLGKNGQSPVQGLIAVLLLRAGFKGLLHAVVFTVVTVLLFKGIWLWLGLGLVLAIALPLFYMVREHKELRGEGGDDDDAAGGSDDGDPAGPATVQPAVG